MRTIPGQRSTAQPEPEAGDGEGLAHCLPENTSFPGLRDETMEEPRTRAGPGLAWGVGEPESPPGPGLTAQLGRAAG